MNKSDSLKICCLVILLFGLSSLLLSMAYFEEDLLLLGLSQMMIGSCGFYILEKNNVPQKLPQSLKRKKG